MLDREVTELIRLVREMGVAELVVERGDTRLHIRRQTALGEEVTVGKPNGEALPAADPEARPILSPAVGRFYRCSRPEGEPATAASQPVSAGQPIGFVETLGLRGEVNCPAAGVGLEFLVEDGQGVEYGQPLALLYPTSG